MRILGIDPGTIVSGYGIVEAKTGRLWAVAYGIIRAKNKDPFPCRLKTIHAGLTKVIERFKPEQIAIEDAFAGKSIKSAIRIGEARGIALLCAASAGIPASSYPAAVIKKSVVGLGSAHKGQVKEMVRLILELPKMPEPEDAADALAIAICHYHQSVFNALQKA